MISLVCASATAIPLPDNSVQCCVTSPPYWGLRKYAGEQELVWGGGAVCAHVWGQEIAGSNRGGSGTPTDKNNRGEGYARAEGRGGTCVKCGAWRGAYGLEPTVEMYVAHTVEVLREVRRVLRDDGVCFWNVGDSYFAHNGTRGGSQAWDDNKNPGAIGMVPHKALPTPGLKPKDLCLIPARVALAAQADGWWVRSVIIWAKPNPMPESVTDRPTDAYEHILMLTKSARYYWDAEAVKEGVTGGSHNRGTKLSPPSETSTPQHIQVNGRRAHENFSKNFQSEPLTSRNLRNVWTFAKQPYSGAHFATFPEELPRRCILAATSAKGACRQCGAPWERVTKSAVRFTSGSGKAGNVPAGKFAGSQQAESGQYDIRMGPQVDSQTIGWRPGCECRGQHGRTRPCVVLDPFGGSGTTGRVASELNRRAVLLDIAYGDEKGYAPLARRRVANVQPILALA